jgi:hypothetical protein
MDDFDVNLAQIDPQEVYEPWAGRVIRRPVPARDLQVLDAVAYKLKLLLGWLLAVCDFG